MNIKSNSTWLFFYKYLKDGAYPTNICEWFWNSLLGILMAVVTPIGFLYSAITREYNLLVGLFINVVILVSGAIGTTIAGYVGAEHSLMFWVYGFVAILSIFIVGVAVIYVIQVCRYIISRGVGKLYNRAYSRSIKRENPLPKLISDFKNKHCTVIKIDHGGDEN